jgi:ankyrin repeat protein
MNKNDNRPLPTKPVSVSDVIDTHGNTTLHHAAYFGYLNKIQSKLITPEALAVQNKNGDTVLHYAAAGGHLDQINPKLLTPDVLSVKNKFGDTVLNHRCNRANRA